METIHPDWKEFLQLLNSHGVKFLLVGGHALAFHGHPRFTADVDIFFATDSENCQKLSEVIKEFGFGSISIAALSHVPQVFMLGNVPFRIDLLNNIDGVPFTEAWNNAIDGSFGGERVKIISRNDLIANKRAAGRTKDLADLEELEGR